MVEWGSAPGTALAAGALSDHSLGRGLLVVSGPFCQPLSPTTGPRLDRDVAGMAASSAPCRDAPPTSLLADASGPPEPGLLVIWK